MCVCVCARVRAAPVIVCGYKPAAHGVCARRLDVGWPSLIVARAAESGPVVSVVHSVVRAESATTPHKFMSRALNLWHVRMVRYMWAHHGP